MTSPGMESEEELEEILQALVHQARRRIIKALAEESSLGFADLKEETGIEDSGTFAFYLRKLQGLVEKNDDGRYKLTEKGWKAYAMLKAYDEPERILKRGKVSDRELVGTVVVKDKVSFHLTEDFVRSAVESGSKVFIKDVVEVIVHPMDRELAEKGLSVIDDVVLVKAPRSLMEVIERKIRDVLLVDYYEGEPPKGDLATLVKSLQGKIAARLRRGED